LPLSAILEQLLPTEGIEGHGCYPNLESINPILGLSFRGEVEVAPNFDTFCRSFKSVFDAINFTTETQSIQKIKNQLKSAILSIHSTALN